VRAGVPGERDFCSAVEVELPFWVHEIEKAARIGFPTGGSLA
jgi:hypothetical protein